MGYIIKANLMSLFVSQKTRTFVATPKSEDLVVLKEFMETGKVTPVIDRTYPRREAPAALGYVEQGHTRGKTVITM